MRNMVLGCVVVCVVLIEHGAALSAPSFVLNGTMHLDVTTAYDRGDLWYRSSADVKAGGVVQSIYVYENSALSVSGGDVGTVALFANTLGNFSDGSISTLYCMDYSISCFSVKDFTLDPGLYFEGNDVNGFGTISGHWRHGEAFSTRIAANDSHSILYVQVVPEPGLLSVTGAAIVALGERRKRRSGAAAGPRG